jgi:fructokinase
VIDTVGAGDAFTGGFLTALCDGGLASPSAVAAAVTDGGALVAALRFAVAVSAMTCERAGADPPTRAELRARAPR